MAPAHLLRRLARPVVRRVGRRVQLSLLRRTIEPAPTQGPKVVLVSPDRPPRTTYRDVQTITSLADPGWRDPSITLVAFVDRTVQPVSSHWLGHLVANIGQYEAAAGPLLWESGPTRVPLQVKARGFNVTWSNGEPALWPIARGASPAGLSTVVHTAETAPAGPLLLRRSTLEEHLTEDELTTEIGLRVTTFLAMRPPATRIVGASMAVEIGGGESPPAIRSAPPPDDRLRVLTSKSKPTEAAPSGWSWSPFQSAVDPTVDAAIFDGTSYDLHASTGAVLIHTRPEVLPDRDLDEFDAVISGTGLDHHALDDRLARHVVLPHSDQAGLFDLAELELSRRWVDIRTAVPDQMVAPRWGDTHFARQFGAALVRRGLRVSVSTREEWWHPRRRSADVVLHLRGLVRSEPHPTALNVLWLISHPDDVSHDELEAHDLVLVASIPYATRLSEELSVPVVPFLQATNPQRFHTMDRPAEREILFAGNSRGIYREAVRWAIEEELPISIAGEGWEGLLPGGIVAGPYIPNERLNEVFASSAIVLADHWPDMARLGFISNRVFDGAASGALVLSDSVAGLADVFGSSVPAFGSAEQLRRLARSLLENATERRRLAGEARRIVLASHTFDHRATAFVEALKALG